MVAATAALLSRKPEKYRGVRGGGGSVLTNKKNLHQNGDGRRGCSNGPRPRETNGLLREGTPPPKKHPGKWNQQLLTQHSKPCLSHSRFFVEGHPCEGTPSPQTPEGWHAYGHYCWDPKRTVLAKHYETKTMSLPRGTPPRRTSPANLIVFGARMPGFPNLFELSRRL